MRVDSAVLALVWGREPKVLITRKSCESESYWSCDVALPGGTIEEGERPEEAALREAWEEANIYPRAVKITSSLGVDATAKGSRTVLILLGEPSGPIDPRPKSREIDFVGWLPLHLVAREPEPVEHPRRGKVVGIALPGGLVLWGFTLRALRRVVQLYKL